MTVKYVQTNTLYQAGAGNIVAATTITLTSLTDIYGNVLTMTDFGSKGYGTCEPDTTNEEGFVFTGITANANGTYTLTGISTILAKSPYTESSGLVRQHAGGTKVVITDNVAFWATFPNKHNAETIDGIYTFATGATPIITDAPVNSTDAANKGYVDGVAIAGGANASSTVKGISKLSLDPVSLTNPIAVGDNDTRVPTAGQAAALPGNNTDVAVGTGNKYVTQTGLQHNAEKYAVDTSGSSTAYVVTLSPAPTSLTDGMVIFTKIVNANTTPTPTLALNGLTARTIVKNGGVPLIPGDISANMSCTFIYDLTNTRWVFQSPSANIPSNLLYQSGTAVTQSIVNTNKNAMITKSIVGGSLGTNNVIHFRGFGTWTGSTGGVVNTIRLDYGASTVLTFAISDAGSGSPVLNFDFDFYLYANASTGAQLAAGYVNGITPTGTVSLFTGKLFVSLNAAGSSSEDSTAAKNLIFSTQLSSTTNPPTLTIIDYTIEVLR